jgi:hypothetical protein
MLKPATRQSRRAKQEPRASMLTGAEGDFKGKMYGQCEVRLKKGGGDVMVLKGGARTIQGFKPLF